MADDSLNSVIVNKKRKRNPNFSRDEVLKLEEIVTKEENLKLITAKFSSVTSNKMKNDLWEEIASEVSALGVCARTATDCSNKWQNLKREAKEAMTEEKLEQRMTGGGPKKMCLSQQQTRIVNVLGGTASFSGITGGLDSDEIDGYNYMANLPRECAEEPKAECAEEPKADETHCDSPALACGTSNLKPTSVMKLKEHMKKSAEKSLKRVTQEDLAAVQKRYFEGEIEKQALEKQKLQLQIKLLQRMDTHNDTISAQDLFAALPFLSQ